MRVIADELDRKEAALEALQNSDSADNVDVELQVFAHLDLQDKTLLLATLQHIRQSTCYFKRWSESMKSFVKPPASIVRLYSAFKLFR